MKMLRAWHLLVAAALMLPEICLAQSSPGLVYGQVPTAAQWNSFFAAKRDYTTGPCLIPNGCTGASTAVAARANLGLAIGSNVEAWFANLDALGGLTGSNGMVPYFTGAGTMGTISDVVTIGGLGCPLGSSCALAFSNLAGIITTAQLPTGKSVADPGTGKLESLLPIQTVTGSSSKTFGTADLQLETRISNGGTAMTGTFPASTVSGMGAGAEITLNNVDATASVTLTAGAGTTISGSGVVGPGRSVRYVYDAGSTIWRPTLNTGTALLYPNALSEISAAGLQATARSNLGLGTAAIKAASGSGGTVASTTGSFTAGHLLTAADTSGTVQDGGVPAVGTITGVTAGTGLTGGGSSGTVTLTLGVPTATTLGGVESLAATAHQFLTSISTAGVPIAAQPAFTDISGSLAAAQLPALSGDISTTAGSAVTTLATVNSNVGTFALATVTLDGKGRATAASAAATTGSGSVVLANTPTLITPNIGAATGVSLSVSGSLTSTVATGTAPLVVSSTTNVPNLNASSLNGATFAAPGAIGATPSTIKATTLTATNTGSLTLGTAGSAVGQAIFNNATSGTITLQPATGALGSVVITMPATAGTMTVLGNTITGSGSTLVEATSPTLTTPNIGVATATQLLMATTVSVSPITIGGISATTGLSIVNRSGATGGGIGIGFNYLGAFGGTDAGDMTFWTTLNSGSPALAKNATLTNAGHWVTGGAVPTCGTGCASIGAASDDNTFSVTTGSAVTSVAVTFGGTWGAAPVCNVSSNSTASVTDISAVSTTAITFGASVALTGGILYVQCRQG